MSVTNVSSDGFSNNLMEQNLRFRIKLQNYCKVKSSILKLLGFAVKCDIYRVLTFSECLENRQMPGINFNQIN